MDPLTLKTTTEPVAVRLPPVLNVTELLPLIVYAPPAVALSAPLMVILKGAFDDRTTLGHSMCWLPTVSIAAPRTLAPHLREVTFLLADTAMALAPVPWSCTEPGVRMP